MTDDTEKDRIAARRIRAMAEKVQAMSDEELEQIVAGSGSNYGGHQYPDPVLQGAIDRAQGLPYDGA